MDIPINLTIATAAALFIQATPPLQDVVGPIERLGVQGIQGVAIYFLWRALSRKDEDLARKDAAKDAAIEAKDIALARKDAEFTAMAIKVTETMALVMEAVKESRRATEELGAAMDNFASNLAAMPCSAGQIVTLHAEKLEQKRLGKPIK